MAKFMLKNIVGVVFIIFILILCTGYYVHSIGKKYASNLWEEKEKPYIDNKIKECKTSYDNYISKIDSVDNKIDTVYVAIKDLIKILNNE